MASKFYGATGFTGGTDGDLDSILGSQLNTGDIALVCDGSEDFAIFRYNSASAVGESATWTDNAVIAPDTGSGEWVLADVITDDMTIQGTFTQSSESVNTLTVGSTVITDQAITDSTGFITITANDGLRVTNSTTTDATWLYAGTTDNSVGYIYACGDAVTDGGSLFLEFAGDSDDNAVYASILAYGDQLRIGTNIDSQLLFYSLALSRWTCGDSFVPRLDSSYNLGNTLLRWATVWADAYYGADYALENGWRILESDHYEGYPKGVAISNKDFVEGEVNYNMPGTPLFAITEDFIEYKGRRITEDQLDKLLELI